MKWDDKMTAMVCDILNENIPDGFPKYDMHFYSDNNFKVLFNEKIILETETIVHLPSHWMGVAVETIGHIIRQRIGNYQIKQSKNLTYLP